MTLSKYNPMWEYFINFTFDFDYEFLERPVAYFVPHLFEMGRKYNTIQVYLVALSHGFKARKIPDYSKSYLVQRLVAGAKKLTFTHDIRQPFTEEHVRKITRAMPYINSTHYEAVLMATVAVWAFSAGLRISQYTEGFAVDHNLKCLRIDTMAVDGALAYCIAF